MWQKSYLKNKHFDENKKKGKTDANAALVKILIWMIEEPSFELSVVGTRQMSGEDWRGNSWRMGRNKNINFKQKQRGKI